LKRAGWRCHRKGPRCDDQVTRRHDADKGNYAQFPSFVRRLVSHFVKPNDGSPASKAFVAMLLSAQASGKSVRVTGTGNCFAGTADGEISDLNAGDWGQWSASAASLT